MARKRKRQRRKARDRINVTPTKDVANKTVATNDGFNNPMSRAGFGMPNLLSSTSYTIDRRLTQDIAQLNALYRSHWIVKRIINVIPQDMLKNGYEIQSDIEPDQVQAIIKTIRQTKLDKKILEGLSWGRLYGGAVGLIVIEGDDERLEEPIDFDLIEEDSFKGLIIIDRWSGVSPSDKLIDSLSDPEFGMPEYYDISISNNGMTGGGTVKRVHHSRICRFVGREMPYLEMLVESYWGVSELEHIMDDIKKRDNTSWNIALLTFMANIRVVKMEGMEEILSLGGQQNLEHLYNTVEGMSMLLNNNAIQVLGQKDDYQQHQYSFSGLGDVYDRFMMDVAGAAEIPVTKLFGRSPAGLNSTGESDMQNYYDMIESLQENQLRPILDKLLPIVCASCLGAIPDDFDYIFNPVRRASDIEKQDLGSQQTNAVTQAFTSGLVSQKTALKELQQSSAKTGMWTNVTDEDVAKADEDVQGVGEEFTLPSLQDEE